MPVDHTAAGSRQPDRRRIACLSRQPLVRMSFKALLPPNARIGDELGFRPLGLAVPLGQREVDQANSSFFVVGASIASIAASVNSSFMFVP